jgi:hypothetical protein
MEIIAGGDTIVVQRYMFEAQSPTNSLFNSEMDHNPDVRSPCQE